MRTISTYELRIAAAKAYAARRLTAQASNWLHRLCRYSGLNDTCCAIGAVLTPNERLIVQARGINSGPLQRLIDAHIVQFEDYDFARQLQRAHDRWASSGLKSQTGPESDETRTERETFEEMVGLDVLRHAISEIHVQRSD